MNSQGLIAWLLQNILPILLVVIGLGIIAASKKKDMSGTATQVILIVIGAIVCGGAGAFAVLGDNLAAIIFTQQ